MNEVKQIFKLAWPLLLTQITTSLMFFTDTVMASRAGHVDMASVSVATGLWSPIIFSAQGLLMAITPVVGHLFGYGSSATKDKESNNAKIVNTLSQGCYLALIVCMLVLLIFQFIQLPLNYLDLEPELQNKAEGYLKYAVWGILPTCLFFVLRSFCEGITQTKPALIVSLCGLILNIPLNYIFVFGKLGMPELGCAGCGLATAIVQWFILLFLVIYFSCSNKLKQFQIIHYWQKPQKSKICQLTKVGLPISLALLFETSLFAFMAIFIAPLGSIALAGHQVAFSYSAVAFMLPLSLAMAATIRIGYLKGFGDEQLLKRSIKTCLSIAFTLGALNMVFTYLAKNTIVRIYTDQTEVFTLASSILMITALYQLPDAIQSMCAGIFKGLKITKPLFYITFVSYWPIGFLIGYLLARTNTITEPMGPQGFWLGTVIGLTTASLLFLCRLKKEY